MKLLFDHNVSPRLARALADLDPGSIHVREVGLHAADDQAVWDYAAEQGFAIVSKDSDFHQRSFLFGPPPKVVWVKLGNCTTAMIERVLRERVAAILSFDDEQEAAFLELQ